MKKKMSFFAVVVIIIISIITILNIFNSKSKENNKIIGIWTTSYELGSYGKVSQTYEINKDKTCSKKLITDIEIKQECTYEIKEDQITFKYEKEEKTYTYRFEENRLILGGYAYEKK